MWGCMYLQHDGDLYPQLSKLLDFAKEDHMPSQQAP